MSEITKKQKENWEKWLAERPDNVRKIAEKIVPWKTYRDKRIENDIGNRYSPVIYDENEDGSVSLTCAKTNKEAPFLGGYNVFGMNPDDLIESK